MKFSILFNYLKNVIIQFQFKYSLVTLITFCKLLNWEIFALLIDFIKTKQTYFMQIITNYQRRSYSIGIN
jgi:hypothetical protein